MPAWEVVLRNPGVRLVRCGPGTEFAVELASGRTVEVLVSEGEDTVDLEFDRTGLQPADMARVLTSLGAYHGCDGREVRLVLRATPR